MTPYLLSEQMTAFVEKTVSFNSTDTSLAGLRLAYSEMCQAFTPPRPEGLYVVDFDLAGVAVRLSAALCSSQWLSLTVCSFAPAYRSTYTST